MKSALTIAGSDSSGGAGIQADIKTMTALGVFAQSAITALTAQNTLGVSGVEVVSASFVREQIDRVFEDIRPDAVKIGMIPSAELVEGIAEGLLAHKACHIVLDPVMVATSGASLSSNEAVQAMVDRLFPLAEVVTPNVPEAEVLAGLSISSADDMNEAAQIILKKGASAVLIKGGHSINGANDFLLKEDGRHVWFKQERVNTNNTHGTGCTLSSAIASFLALGFDVEQSVARAKEYLTQALKNDPHLGKGSSPLNHMWMNERGYNG